MSYKSSGFLPYFVGTTYLVALYFVTFVYGMFMYIVGAISPKALHFIQGICNMSVARMILFSAGIKMFRSGYEHIVAMENKSYLLVSNHVTTLDPPILIVGMQKSNYRLVYSLRATAKVPFIGKLVGAAFDSMGWISIKHDENDSTALKRVINVARSDIKKHGHTQLAIFPEGIRTEDGKINNFQRGPFFLSLFLQIPIIPVLMQGVYSIHRHQTFVVNPGDVTVKVLEPVYPPKIDKKNLRKQAETFQAQVEKFYKELPNINTDAHAYKKKHETTT
ncbi:MAG: 1-acyl-sn-glycerol-3-phosphate acyltransferase [Candidatus Portiera sp.]|nr:1-acyl-sn-glycerol-3-phosphate acyltransferase [Portiera sp.]